MHSKSAAHAGPCRTREVPREEFPEFPAEADGEMESLPLQRLLCIARQSGLGTPSGCAMTLGLLLAGRAVRQGIHRMMKPLGLSEARFLALVTLYALDPAPSNPANLAYHVQITRTAMTDTLDQMEKRGWIHRKRQQADRRVVHVFLTNDGREAALKAIRQFLSVASGMSENVGAVQHRVFGEVCRALRTRAQAFVG